jgi:hypothetical protein
MKDQSIITFLIIYALFITSGLVSVVYFTIKLTISSLSRTKGSIRQLIKQLTIAFDQLHHVSEEIKHLENNIYSTRKHYNLMNKELDSKIINYEEVIYNDRSKKA